MTLFKHWSRLVSPLEIFVKVWSRHIPPDHNYTKHTTQAIFSEWTNIQIHKHKYKHTQIYKNTNTHKNTNTPLKQYVQNRHTRTQIHKHKHKHKTQARKYKKEVAGKRHGGVGLPAVTHNALEPPSIGSRTEELWNPYECGSVEL